MSERAAPGYLEEAQREISASKQGADLEAALGALLAAWRACRCAAIADVIDRISGLAAATRPPVAQGTHKTMTAAWLAREAERSHSDVPLLLDSLNQRTRSDIATGRLDALAQRSPDPRISAQLCEWLDLAARVQSAAPWQGPSGRRFYLRSLDLLESIGDPRCVPLLREHVERRRRTVIIARAVHKRWKPLSEKLAATLEPAQPSAEVLERCTSIEVALGDLSARSSAEARSTEELLELVYQAPDDAEARFVYADRLQEVGDPRGEFIALQLEREQEGGKVTSRERRLLKDYGRRWLGALEPMVLKSGVEYRGGFPYRCRLKAGFVDVKEWLTVRAVDCEEYEFVGLAEQFLDPAWRNVRRVWGVGLSECKELSARSARLSWVEIGLRSYPQWVSELTDWLRDGGELTTVFPRLRELDLLRVPTPPAELFQIASSGKLGEQIGRLVLPLGDSLEVPLSWLASAPQIEALRLVSPHATRHELDRNLGARYQRRQGGGYDVSVWGIRGEPLRALASADGVASLTVYARRDRAPREAIGAICGDRGIPFAVEVATVGPAWEYPWP